ncbi:MAG: AMP-binding protein [Methylococcaceae bacterium]|nr:AMP-binding protein [Methylococcaceae bacterium]
MTTHNSHLISLPQLIEKQLKRPFCLTQNGSVFSRADLLHDALQLSKQLPDNSYALNLCQQRYFFMVAYLAVILKGQTTLLPPNQATGTINSLLKDYKQSYCISDVENNYSKESFIVNWDLLKGEEDDFPLIDIEKTVSISFTSGSTGEPKAIVKNWREFQKSAELALQQLDLQQQALTLVSTVPMQHMYGLETSLFWTLFSNLCIHNSRPFYPQDIRATLISVENAMLISTPTHLKSCVNSQSTWPHTQCLLSSTASMSIELATEIEQRFNAPLYEVYGSTETLSFASRRSTHSKHWQPYQGIKLYQQAAHFFVKGGHLLEAVELDDNFDIEAEGRFINLGRAGDLIKIGGKRASLIELNRILLQLPRVKDGIFFKTEKGRLSALVVSDASKKEILEELKHSIDVVFLPRTLYQVEKLPRNEMGKIIKTELDKLIEGLKRG